MANFVSMTAFVKIVTKQANDHWFNIAKTSQGRKFKSGPWKPPPMDWIKANMDSTFVNGNASAGVVLRISNGSIIYAFTASHHCIDSTTAEALAILDTCFILKKLKCKKVILESDNLNAIAFFINGNSDNIFWACDPVITQIKRIWNGWPCWQFKFKPRASNGAAHSLAKWNSL
ncbi:hypothetical protein CASFOL_013843 [Castilleja foliolosa]|uniref:RNase H type-1 domain-containing protein n=1 Tax=Castilleja foliolosa TaxID=1961234 RepID=A0ABD3DL60_9LAMI